MNPGYVVFKKGRKGSVVQHQKSRQIGAMEGRCKDTMALLGLMPSSILQYEQKAGADTGRARSSMPTGNNKPSVMLTVKCVREVGRERYDKKNKRESKAFRYAVWCCPPLASDLPITPALVDEDHDQQIEKREMAPVAVLEVSRETPREVDVDAATPESMPSMILTGSDGSSMGPASPASAEWSPLNDPVYDPVQERVDGKIMVTLRGVGVIGDGRPSRKAGKVSPSYKDSHSSPDSKRSGPARFNEVLGWICKSTDLRPLVKDLIRIAADEEASGACWTRRTRGFTSYRNGPRAMVDIDA
ncbi:hypothetical protein PUNSTDRAFT_43116 [Punctularia strigosozonata HHB-11173 SS5]|uniref:uncharacterized protein n=1 Tax=Punctularia strigosozonata (strain HHB-11173) TaxID=741275 RepID=UPI00044171FE|nr:uncharacterized protein PUNSTDRAFT_43116 [Punctularia strigosozonata HHB-11173 SS5]EIN12065.1 hypothetical protein PUNSTDRAFT_43116 [Punctularia strigosozonata HHB-11173 SS5]